VANRHITGGECDDADERAGDQRDAVEPPRRRCDLGRGDRAEWAATIGWVTGGTTAFVNGWLSRIPAASCG
jgi:hypothetical protein